MKIQTIKYIDFRQGAEKKSSSVLRGKLTVKQLKGKLSEGNLWCPRVS